MSAAARRQEDALTAEPVDPRESAEPSESIGNPTGTEYVTRGARGHRSARPHLRMVSPLRPERPVTTNCALIIFPWSICGG